MGQVLAALSQARQAKQAIAGPGDTSDPGVQLTPVSLPGLSAPDASQPMQGGDMPSSGNPLLSMTDLLGSPQQEAPQQQVPVDNPYTLDDNTQNPAANIGSSQDDPIVISKDTWTPPQKEGWLGKTLDVLEMLRGRGTPFKDRKDEENIQDAMKNYQTNPQQAIRRVAQVDVPTALKIQGEYDAQQANQELAHSRAIDRMNTGADRLGAMLGVVQNAQDPNAMYSKLLPSMQGFAKMYGLDPSVLPDQYDPDKIGALRMGGISTYDQGRLAQEAANAQNIQNYRQTMVQLDKLGKEISLGNLKESQRHNLQTEADYAQGRVLQAKQQASKEGVTLNDAFGPYMGMKPGQYVVSPDKTQVIMKRPDGYLYRFPIQRRPDGSAYVDTDNPTLRGTTVQGYLSK